MSSIDDIARELKADWEGVMDKHPETKAWMPSLIESLAATVEAFKAHAEARRSSERDGPDK